MVKRPPPGSIPDTPGSYQFKDADGRVIYVGKARSLRSRLSNYFQNPRNMHPRTAQMVATAETVEWIQVRNDVEALMLEYNLLKEHRPRFTVRLGDDDRPAVPIGDRGGPGRRLPVPLVSNGHVVGQPSLAATRAWCGTSRQELPDEARRPDPELTFETEVATPPRP